ncbi:hypothetical protein ASE35_16035 [Lysobacter sp. Root916]|uniref:hypothetical protein n=1 Tax=Lysobacter sp. Root916 TaxID=1736606 RepID=UPI000710A554|nr:hypothetical protein [Lysobacter sp. Root916]KRD31504.1 hypothetical protein ASE35_16035 [Lysobacter sp. Root916]
MVYVLLVIAAWGSLFFRLPVWLSILSSCAFLGLGAVFLLFGLAGSYWDSHMTSGDSAATSTLVTGVLLLLSRAALVVKLILHALVAPPEP